MEVWEWGPFIRRRIKTIIGVTVLVVAVVMGATFVLPPTYRSTVILTIQPLAHDQALSFPSSSQLGARNAGELIKSPAVSARAAVLLGKEKLEGTPDYRVPENSGLVEVVVDADTPQLAADEANAIATAFIASNAESVKASVGQAQTNMDEQLARLRKDITSKQDKLAAARSNPASATAVNDLQDELDTLRTGYEGVLARAQSIPSAETLLVTSVSVADKAIAVLKPVAPRPLLNLVLAIAGGLLLGIAVARATEPPTDRNPIGT